MAGDSGRSWKWHDLPFESYGALRLEVVDATTLLATSPEGLYISRDGGTAWSNQPFPLVAEFQIGISTQTNLACSSRIKT
jgi:hypothetical protein